MKRDPNSGKGGAYVRHPITGRLHPEGTDEAEKILAGEIHAAKARAEMAAEAQQEAADATSGEKATPKPKAPPRRKRAASKRRRARSKS